MIDFEKFFLGEVGIIVRNESEAVELTAACEEDGIEIGFTAGAYEKYPYWVVSGRELLALKTYQEAMEHVEHVYSYQTYAFDNQIYGYRQMERQRILAPLFTGSNPVTLVLLTG